MKKFLLILVLILVGGGAVLYHLSQPVMNDITTSVNNPPQFDQVLKQNPEGNYSYPPAFAQMQKEHYPQIKPIRVRMPANDVFSRVMQVADGTTWTLLGFNPFLMKLEATDESKLFKFVDDIVVEVRDMGGGVSEVHMRSKSRTGKSDLGVNAKRVETFLDQVRNLLE